MQMATPSFDGLMTVGGIAVVVTILTQVILNAANLSDLDSNRWGPLLALTLGILIGIGAEAILVAPATAVNLGQGALTGLYGGGSAIALHGVFTKSMIGEVIASALGIESKPSVPTTTGVAVTTSGPRGVTGPGPGAPTGATGPA